MNKVKKLTCATDYECKEGEKNAGNAGRLKYCAEGE